MAYNASLGKYVATRPPEQQTKTKKPNNFTANPLNICLTSLCVEYPVWEWGGPFTMWSVKPLHPVLCEEKNSLPWGATSSPFQTNRNKCYFVVKHFPLLLSLYFMSHLAGLSHKEGTDLRRKPSFVQEKTLRRVSAASCGPFWALTCASSIRCTRNESQIIWLCPIHQNLGGIADTKLIPGFHSTVISARSL